MKKAWKWILGIIIVLVIIAAVVAVPLVMRNYMAARIPANSTNTLPQGRGWNGNGNGNGWNMMPGNGNRQGQGGFNGRGGPMMGGGRGLRGFGGGFSPFGFGFMFLGGLLRLIPWLLLGLILWGVYQLGRRSGLRTNQAIPVASTPATSAPAQPVVTEPDSPQNPTA